MIYDSFVLLYWNWLLFTMGNADTKLNFRKAVVQLTSKTQVWFLATDFPNVKPILYIFLFTNTANRSFRWSFLVPVLVREHHKHPRCVCSNSCHRNTCFKGRMPIKFSHIMLQSSWKTCTCCRFILCYPTRTLHRWLNKKSNNAT